MASSSTAARCSAANSDWRYGPSYWSEVMPSQAIAARMPSVHSGLLREASVSSIRSTNVPPCCLANTQFCSATRALPTWNIPVGEGAKRTRTVTPSSLRGK